MSEKNQLNAQDLEKVSGGIKTVDNIKLYEDKDLFCFKEGVKVSIYSGARDGNSFQYLCDGVITNVNVGYVLCWRVDVKVSNNPSIKDASFFGTGGAQINGKDAVCWFGPKQ